MGRTNPGKADRRLVPIAARVAVRVAGVTATLPRVKVVHHSD